MWKKIKSHPWWLALGSVFIALALFAGWQLWGKAPATPAVITAEVVRGNIEDSVLAAGTIQAAKLINVGAQVSGQVKKLHVKLGDVVEPGQPIAEIDAATQQNNLKDAQAALGSAQAQKSAKQSALALAQNNFERQKYMFEHEASSKADYQSAQHALAAAKAELAAAEAAIAQHTVRVQTAQTNLGYTRITAPMAGTVVAIVTDEGQTVNANQTAPTIIKLAQLDAMTIQAQISEADVPRVQAGMEAWFTILGEPERRHQASLRSIEPGPIDINSYDGRATSNNSNTAVYYNGVLDVPNADGKLRIQMTAQVNIVLRQANNVLLIPAGALGKRVKGENAPDSKNQADKPSANTASGAQAASPASSSSSSSSANSTNSPSAAPAGKGSKSGKGNREGGAGAAQDGKPAFYTVRVATGEKGEQKIEERKVKIGLNNRVQAEVLEGLKEGDKVVVGTAAAGAEGQQRRVRVM